MPDLQTMEATLGRSLAHTFRDTADALSSKSERLGSKLLNGWTAGKVTDAEFVELLTNLVQFSVGAGLTAGDVIGSGYLGRDPVGLTISAGEMGRLADAAKSTVALLDAPDAPTARLLRLVSGEALHHLQDGTRRAYDAHGVDGYRRGLSANACQLCHWLYKNGYVYPSDQPMHKHPGCTCVPIPATRPKRKRRK